MSGLKLSGIILVVIGAIFLAYQGFSYTKKHEILRIGDASVTATTKERVNIPTWAGFVVVGAGIVLLVAAHQRRAA